MVPSICWPIRIRESLLSTTKIFVMENLYLGSSEGSTVTLIAPLAWKGTSGFLQPMDLPNFRPVNQSF